MSARVHFIALTASSRRLFAAVSVALLLALCAGAAAAQTEFEDEASAATKNLFAAVRKNDLPAVQSAITAGADIEAVNSWGLTPVDLAVDKGHYEIAHFILSLRSFRAKTGSSGGKGARKQTQPQFRSRSSGSKEAQKSVGYGLIPRKSTSERGPAPPPLVTPAAPVTKARSAPIEDRTPKGGPSWPAGKPNPFDPDYVAPDATVTVIGKVYKPGQVPKGASKSGARQTIPGLPKLKKAPRTDIAVAQAPQAPPKAKKPPKVKEKGVMDSVLDVVTFGLLGEDEEKQPDFVVEKAPPAAPSAPKAVTSTIKKPTMQAAPRKPSSKAASSKAPPPKPSSKAASPKAVPPKATSPKVAAKAPPPKAASPKVAAKAASANKTAAPASVVPSVTSTATSTATSAAAPSKGFLGSVMSVLTFGLLDEDDKEDDGVDVKAEPPNAPVQPAPPASKKAPPRLAKAPAFTPPTLAEPASLAKLPPLIKLKKSKPPAPERATAPTTASGGWSVKGVETAAEAKPPAVKPPTPSLPENYLKGTELTLGLSVKLGSPLRLPKKKISKFGRVCVEKKSGAVSFCIKPVDWPSEIKPMVLVGTVMYSGLKTIVRYDEGRATRFHSLFPSASFAGIVAYYTRRYGAPTGSLKRSIAPLAARRRDNPTAIWRSVDPVTKQVTTLEIRKFDDTRGGFPDTERGAIMLYHKYSKPIFPQLSAVELMLLRPNEVL